MLLLLMIMFNNVIEGGSVEKKNGGDRAKFITAEMPKKEKKRSAKNCWFRMEIQKGAILTN